MKFGHPFIDAAIFLLGAFGLAYVVGFSAISFPLRMWLGGVPAPAVVGFVDGKPLPNQPAAVPGALGPFGDFLCKLLECPACFGFWTGAIFGLTVRGDSFPTAFWLGLAVSGSNFILSRLTRLI